MTKKNMGFISSYNRSTMTSLREAYSRMSYAKEQAERECLKKMYDLDGYGFRIMSYNSHNFTCGFLYEQEGKIFLNVETSQNTYKIEYVRICKEKRCN